MYKFPSRTSHFFVSTPSVSGKVTDTSVLGSSFFFLSKSTNWLSVKVFPINVLTLDSILLVFTYYFVVVPEDCRPSTVVGTLCSPSPSFSWEPQVTFDLGTSTPVGHSLHLYPSVFGKVYILCLRLSLISVTMGSRERTVGVRRRPQIVTSLGWLSAPFPCTQSIRHT